MSRSTPPERILWSHLRDRKLGGLKFRRQHQIGPYVVDFYCAEAQLVVELDGRHHTQQVERDAERDEWLRDQGLGIIRVSVSQFTRNTPGVLRLILATANERKKG